MITKDNVEDYIIDYLSDELTEKEIYELKEFLLKNPEYNELIEDYKETFVADIQDDVLIYPHKNALRQPESPKFFFSSGALKYIAGAAILATGMMYYIMRDAGHDTEINEKPGTHLSAHTSPAPDRLKADKPAAQAPQNPFTVQQQTAERMSGQDKAAGNSKSKAGNGSEAHEEPVTAHIKNPENLVPTLSVIRPVDYKIRVKQPDLVIYTHYIPASDIPDITQKKEENTDMEVSIAGRTLDVNIDQLKEIKEKVDDVKNTIINKVENAEIESFNLWNAISK